MTFYRRRLPHLYEADRTIFLTWRLYDSLPANRHFASATVSSGRAFAALDRLLDEARSGPFYLRQTAIASMVVDAIHYNANTLGHYDLHAFCVMPNHVHLLATPTVALPRLTKSLKNITAMRANAMLALTGRPFWQEESYDRLVRNQISGVLRRLAPACRSSIRSAFNPYLQWVVRLCVCVHMRAVAVFGGAKRARFSRH